MRVIELTLEDAAKLYNEGGIGRKLALSVYSEEEIRISQLPNSWEEFCKLHPVKGKEYYLTERGSISMISANNSEEFIRSRNPIEDEVLMRDFNEARWMKNLYKLIRLKWIYNSCESINSVDVSLRYSIVKINGEPTVVSLTDLCHDTLLTFKSKELAELFLANFDDIIRKAGDLI